MLKDSVLASIISVDSNKSSRWMHKTIALEKREFPKQPEQKKKKY